MTDPNNSWLKILASLHDFYLENMRQIDELERRYSSVLRDLNRAQALITELEEKLRITEENATNTSSDAKKKAYVGMRAASYPKTHDYDLPPGTAWETVKDPDTGRYEWTVVRALPGDDR